MAVLFHRVPMVSSNQAETTRSDKIVTHRKKQVRLVGLKTSAENPLPHLSGLLLSTDSRPVEVGVPLPQCKTRRAVGHTAPACCLFAWASCH